uniref:ABC transporter domain-containing protein n=1 Tax=Panagrellus redivivus TaxID=6233 RepID=A0A7E4WE17_PANRE
MEPDIITPSKVFKPVDITGNYKDIDRTVSFIKPISSLMCNKTTIKIGFAFPENINDSVMHLFGERYTSKDSRYKVVPYKFHSLDEMRMELYNDLGFIPTNSSNECGQYIGGIYISNMNISTRQFNYRIFVRDKVDSYWHTNNFWPDGGPYGEIDVSNEDIPKSPPYWTSGFLSFQRALDSIFLKMVGKPTDTPVQLNRFPMPRFQIDGALMLINSMPVLFVFLVIGVLLHTTKEIVSEKESGIRTHLLVMGLDSLAFYGSHFVIALIKIMIVMGISSIILARGFQHVSMFLFVPFCLLFSVAVILISILVSVCSRRTSVAIVAMFVIWFGMYQLDDYLDLTPTRIGTCFLGSLNVLSAFTLGIQAMGSFESRTIHLNWINVFAESTVSFSIGCAFLMLIVDILIMLVLIYYFDNVWPTDDAPRKHPLFFLPCIGKQNWADAFNLDSDDNSFLDNIEPETGSYEDADISIRDVTKIYDNGHTAVDRLRFNAYRGQLTVLLGHNGAGKSTTFSIISGSNSATLGEVFICNRSISGNLNLCQKEIGYCPQYNPLFEKLTVEEHLRLYGRLKSDIWDTVGEERITRLLNKTNLMEKREELADKLSGGIKRKLCVAMALVGNSRVVLLDEPTAGMDPEARQNMAKMLESEKRNRTILLTTHNMDEADLLGDQIAIMCKGRLVCKGSSEYLKSRFGTGYLLTLVVDSNANIHEDSAQLARDASMDVIKKYVPNAKLESVVGLQFSVSMSPEHKKAFANLFEELESRKGELDLSTFGLSLSTLEQVFLRVGEMADPSCDQNDYEYAAARASALFGHCEYEASPFTLFSKQILAILYRYFLNGYRHKLRSMVPFIVLLLTSMMAFGVFSPAVKQARTISLLHQQAYTIPMQLSSDEKIANFTQFASKVPHSKPISFPQNGNFTKEVLDHGYDSLALGIGVQAVNKTYRMFFNGAAYHGPPLTLNFLSNTLLNESINSITAAVEVYSPESEDSKQRHKLEDAYGTTYFLTVVCFPFLTSLFVMPLIEDRVSCFKHQLLLTKLSRFTYWLAVTLFFLIFYKVFCLIFCLILRFYGLMTPTSCLVVIMLNVLYFIAATPMSYVASFAFTSPMRAVAAMLSINFIAGPILAVTITLLLFIFDFINFYYIFNLITLMMLPSFALGSSISDALKQCSQTGSVEDWDTIRTSIISMIVSGCFWWMALLFLEDCFERITDSIKRRFRRGYETLSDSQIDPDPEEPIDEDVLNEEFRVHETPPEDLALSVRDISKYFGNFRALRDVTFGVNPNDCFGLLGVNGAGKTTIFDIITGRTLATSGNAHVSGVDIRQMPVIGYCPQFDALPTDLTGRQVLTILGRLNAFYNKRRISIGVTLMSRASLIMLDEPTAGIDPKTRRHIWNLLCAIRDQRVAILLTSHSMDECEVLCSRIGFLNNGSLISIGSSQHLKSRFGNSFLLTLTVSNPSVNNLKYLNIIVAKKFGAKPTQDPDYMNVLHWEIPRREEDSWSDLYRRAHEVANCHHPTFATPSTANSRFTFACPNGTTSTCCCAWPESAVLRCQTQIMGFMSHSIGRNRCLMAFVTMTNRDVYDEIFCPMLSIGMPPQLTFVSDGVIKNLIIPKLTPKVDNAMAFAAWKNLKIERIEFRNKPKNVILFSVKLMRLMLFRFTNAFLYKEVIPFPVSLMSVKLLFGNFSSEPFTMLL